jgi:hypothetical protein
VVAGAELVDADVPDPEDGVPDPEEDEPDLESLLEDVSEPPDFSPDDVVLELFDAESRLSVR